MLGSIDRSLAGVFEREIRSFVSKSAADEDANLYRSCRAVDRQHRACAILVTRLDEGSGSDVRAMLHNISGDGIGFFCDEAMPIGAVLGIKLFWSDPNANRVPAVVRHCTRTNRGNLIGAEFALLDEKVCAHLNEPIGHWYG